MDDVGSFGRRKYSFGEPKSRKYFISCRLRNGSDEDGRRSLVNRRQCFDSVGAIDSDELEKKIHEVLSIFRKDIT